MTDKERQEAIAACNILGVTLSDTWQHVKTTYRGLVRTLHPDTHKTGDPESAKKTERFREVQMAYKFLEKHTDYFASTTRADLNARLNYFQSTLSAMEGDHLQTTELHTLIVGANMARLDMLSPRPTKTLQQVLRAYARVDEEIQRLKKE